MAKTKLVKLAYQQVQLPKQLIRRLQRRARAHGMSLNKYCQLILEEVDSDPQVEVAIVSAGINKRFGLEKPNEVKVEPVEVANGGVLER